MFQTVIEAILKETASGPLVLSFAVGALEQKQN
jgi:hypothetical protein